jgi:CRP-like cAMP-binding protein
MVGYEFLKSHSLFGGITDDELKRIVPLLKEQKFEKGTEILREGENNDCLYFICEGSVEVIKECGQSRECKRIATLGVGDTFGEMELIDIEACPATVKTLMPTTALTLSNRDLYGISKWNMKTYTLIIMNLARELGRRLRRMDELFVASGET